MERPIKSISHHGPHAMIFLVMTTHVSALRLPESFNNMLADVDTPTDAKNASFPKFETGSMDVGKVAFFFTTSGQEHHKLILRDCWPKLMKQLPVLSKADVMLHCNGNESKHSFCNVTSQAELEQIMQKFPNKVARILTSPNYGYQKGAPQQMYDGLHKNVFEGYDWIIKIDADTIIVNEKPVVTLMANEAHAAVFSQCGRRRPDARHKGFDQRLQTEFYAFRPKYVHEKEWSGWKHANDAEMFATRAFTPIMKAGMDSWLHGTSVGSCHVHFDGVCHGGKRPNQCARQCLQLPSFMKSNDKGIMDLWRILGRDINDISNSADEIPAVVQLR